MNSIIHLKYGCHILFILGILYYGAQISDFGNMFHSQELLGSRAFLARAPLLGIIHNALDNK